MGDKIVLDGELSLNIPLDGEAGTIIEVGHDTGIDTIVFNPDYTLTFNMTNGETFTTGSIRGEQGAQGAKGERGDDYVLTQQDKEDIAGLVDAPVDDVQINGTSIVSGGIAEIPIASNNGEMGLAKVNSSLGTGIGIDQDGLLAINPAGTNGIKAGIGYTPIVPSRQHQSAFYGLAKAAGDTTQSQSDNPVGTYTEDAKTAIRTMLGLQEVYDDYSSALTALGVIE